MIENNKLINVHSSAIHIENKVGLKSRLSWFYMLYKAFPLLKKQNTFTVTIGELKKAIGYTSNNNHVLKKALEELARTEIQWNIFDKDSNEWGISHLLSECRIKMDSNIIHYEYSSFVKEKLSNPEMYVKINLLVSKNFKSKHTLSLYCLALDYLYIKNNYGEKNLSVDDMRKYLGLEDSEYKNNGELYKHIIRKAEEEINKNSDLNITFEPVRAERNKILSFKFKMFIKEQYLDSYKPQKVIKQIEQEKPKEIIREVIESVTKKEALKPIELTQVAKTLKSKINIENTQAIQHERIKIKNQALNEFFAEYKLSISTNTVQEKLREIKDKFHDKFEDYLTFLMKYTNQELKRNNINNISGFFVGLLKDDSQLDNYIIEHQKKEVEKQSAHIKIDYLVNKELRNEYDKYLSSDFYNYLLDNIDELEEKTINLVHRTAEKGSYFYDMVLSKHNFVFNKNLLTETKHQTKNFVMNHLNNYKDNFDYEPLTFEEWKNQEITEEDIRQLEIRLSK